MRFLERIHELLERLHNWFWLHQPHFRRMKPGVHYHDGIDLTELLLKDVPIVWVRPFYTPDAEVELGYDFDGNLVAMRVSGDLRKRRVQ